MLAVSVALYLGTTKAYSFTIAANFVIGGYAALLFSEFGFPIWATILIAAMVTASIQTILDWLLFNPLRKAGRSSLAEFVASMGIYLIVVNTIAICFSNELRLVNRDAPRKVLSLMGGTLTEFQAYSVLTIAIVAIGVVVWIYRSRPGMLIQAIAENPLHAQALGIPVDRLRHISMTMVGAMSGFVGAMSFWDVGVTPEAGMRPFLLGAVAAVLGGRAGVIGAIFGACLLSFANEFSIGILPGTWSDSIAFGILLFALLLQSFRRNKDR